MRALARRLLDVEAASQSATGAGAQVLDGVRVCEKLQISVTKFAGSDGFNSLLRRALALARAEVPSLQTVKVGPNGSLEGCEALAANGGPDGAVAIIAHLLGLLETFVGEPFTLRLVREAWPDASLRN